MKLLFFWFHNFKYIDEYGYSCKALHYSRYQILSEKFGMIDLFKYIKNEINAKQFISFVDKNGVEYFSAEKIIWKNMEYVPLILVIDNGTNYVDINNDIKHCFVPEFTLLSHNSVEKGIISRYNGYHNSHLYKNFQRNYRFGWRFKCLKNIYEYITIEDSNDFEEPLKSYSFKCKTMKKFRGKTGKKFCNNRNKGWKFQTKQKHQWDYY